MFKEYDVVIAKKNLSDKVKLGMRGAVLLVFRSNRNKYEVEFVDDKTGIVELLTVDEINLDFDKC